MTGILSTVLVQCNGQDIARKCVQSKSKNKIMIVFPSNFALPHTDCDYKFGSIRNLNSSTPEFIVNTAEVSCLAEF